MKILALEFSFSRERSLALFDVIEGEARMIQSVRSSGSLGSPLMAMLPPVWENFNPAEIEVIAVGLGPGSYTGIRSALAVAQGWNLAKNIPAAGVSSADAIALRGARQGLRGEVEVVIDAQRNEVYSAMYDLGEDAFERKNDLEILKAPRSKVIIGPEAKKWSPDAIEILPTAWAVGMLAAKMSFGPPERLEPIYLREPSFVKAPPVRHQ